MGLAERRGLLRTEGAGAGTDDREPEGSSVYQGARREIASLLRGMEDKEAVDGAEESSPRTWRQRPSPRVILAFLIALASVAWIATRSTTQFVLHRRIEREANRIAERIEAYRSTTNLYPERETWRQWVTGSDAASFLDPWQRPYLYDLDSHAFSIATHGADGRVGGSGEDADLMFVFPYANRRLALPRAQARSGAGSP
jgi:Type II secretion system (T2SS), protein G